MPILMGPVLSFRGCSDGNWKLSVLVVTSGESVKISVKRSSIRGDILWRHDHGAVYRHTLVFPMKAEGYEATYKVDGQSYEIAIPGQGQNPTIAYASCNGFSSLKLMKGVKDKNAVWKIMARRHGLEPLRPGEDAAPTPYNLLLQGGDQVYADAMWEVVPAMNDWNGRDWVSANAAAMSAGMQADLDTFFFDLYVQRWSQPEVAAILARVPSIAMWDDHDLVDGWGSYPPERQDYPVFNGIWTSASKAFAVFQQHLLDDERRPGAIGNADPGWWRVPSQQATRSGAFSFGYVIGSVAILAIDMRSQRTDRSRVVGLDHWDEIYGWLDALNDVDHVLVLSSIPVVYPGFDTIESLLGVFPGHQDLEDDLRDHWNSRPHKGERLRLIYRLLDLGKRGMRPTILSGDVHVAALGIVESKREQAAGSSNVINQLISSAIVHPGPGAVVLFALRHLFDSEDEIDRGLVGRMVSFPNSQAKFLGSRNYLSLEPDRDGRLWCNWFVEAQEHPFTKVVHPLSRTVNASAT